MEDEILKIGQEQIPYFRTNEFSKIMLENEDLIKKLVRAENNARAVFLTASGTGAMEATVMNTLDRNDLVLVINGGSFGNRFSEICDIHEISHIDIKLKHGEILTEEHLNKYSDKKITALLVNIHETSTGMLYDIDIISRFCKKMDCILIVDAISSFLADKLNMREKGIDVLITASQKALALPPGISIIILNQKAMNKMNNIKVKSMYFNINNYLKNGERGQTPFTPAVSILLQLNARLKSIDLLGIENFEENTRILAEDFRKKIVELPFEIVNLRPSNAVTAIKPIGKMKAHDIFEYLKDNYNIFICPNGGDLRDKIFRVGHIGNLSIEKNDVLINALKDMHEKGMF
ncbi:aminotransferase class V-fold PLP-dependent enzyme [Clostridium perfringens]|nr:aminotransferase class V-fold PLP-dependent enzyme [Clostridium perfringens]MDK0552939.1 aminotransferase class V-fold PLP-dependent enzyme [Clostridium perfringens]MDK0834137.1 aminotransferase class V-fold PLP-dependent enzyme [Clostridium perfringens]MDK0878291.1 aminotransferase class V-fold PLP-dependent enzyme [Clostridium perfringens]